MYVFSSFIFKRYLILAGHPLMPCFCWFLNSNLTKTLKELKESCRKQNEELQDILIQREKVQKDTITNGEHEDTLVNDNGLEKPAASTPSKVKGAKKSAKKEEVDLGSEDEALHVEDLEPPGIAASKVNFIGSGDGHHKTLNA